MKMKMKNENEKINEISRKDLQKYYKFVYTCIKCQKPYGSDNKKKIQTCTKCSRLIIKNMKGGLKEK